MAWATTRLNLRYHWKAVLLCGAVALGLLIGGFAHAHNFDPDNFQPTGTTQRTVEYDPLHNFAAGTVTTSSTGLQPLVGEYECEGVSDFQIDTEAGYPTQALIDDCEVYLPYVYPNEEIQCRVVSTGLTFALTVERAWVCFPSFADCFVYDESIPAYMPQAGCAYQAYWTGVLTDEQSGLRTITQVTEEITYTSAAWDAERQRIRAGLSGTLTGEVKRIDLDFSAVDTNRRANLENPQVDAYVSGIGQITGWACADLPLEVQIYTHYGGIVARFPVPHGVSRADTESFCGDTLNGFSTLFNWNELPPDSGGVIVHLIQQGKIIATAPVRFIPFEENFIRGATGSAVVQDFPAPGQSVVVEWQESSQNFVITERR